MLLLVAVGVITSESVRRLMEPAGVATVPVMITAGVGVVINTLTALMFMRGRKHDPFASLGLSAPGLLGILAAQETRQ